jgi:hypothetical protein
VHHILLLYHTIFLFFLSSRQLTIFLFFLSSRQLKVQTRKWKDLRFVKAHTPSSAI